MAPFFILLGIALVGVIIYAAFADHAARKAGMVLVPVKENRFGRTKFVRVARDELDEQLAASIIAERERQLSEAEHTGGMVTSQSRFIKSFARTMLRLR